MKNEKLKNHNPPFFAELLMKLFFSDKGNYTTIGDLCESYKYILEKNGKLKANWWYRKEVIKSIHFLFIHIIIWSTDMFRSYLKLAWRNIIKHKTHSLINLTGLTFGIAASIFILLFVTDELSFDKFHDNYNVTARLINEEFVENGNNQFYPYSTAMSGKMLKENYPEVINYVNVIDNNVIGRPIFTYGEKQFVESGFIFTTPEFFEVFNFDLIIGNSNEILSQPNQMIITESAASKYFGTENPIGKTITTDRQGLEFVVSGIMKDPPGNSHIQFTMLLSIATLTADPSFKRVMNNWDISATQQYLVFKDRASLEAFDTKLKSFVEANKTGVFGTTETLHLQPMDKIHFNSNHFQFERDYGSRSITAVYILSIIGLFIMLSACINYSNLSIARYFNRAKEFGMRKVVGASRKQLFFQVISDAVILSVIALTASLIIVYLLLPFFNAYFEKQLSINFADNFFILFSVLILALSVGIVSGALPAFFITKIKTVALFKLKLNPSGFINVFRKSLVVVQFVISIMMIFATITVYNQMQYIKNKDLGFDKEQIMTIDINSRFARNSFQAMKTEFEKHPSVSLVSVSSRVPGDWKGIREVETRKFGEPDEAKKRISYIGADKDFMNVFKIKLIAGNNFTGNPQTDSLNILLNEAAVKTLGLENPVGKTLQLEEDEILDYKIAGVVKDFNYKSLHEKVAPLIIGYRLNPFISIDYFTVKFNVENISQSIDYFQSVHEQFDKTTPMEFNFLDDRIADFYREEKKESIIINLASIISIFISCLGLFGLASYTAQQKIKEIGIRKVLGASVSEIIIVFSNQFIKLVAFATLIALPVAYYFMNQWLQGFAYKIQIGALEILISALSAFIISFVTISYQAVKSANTNPVKTIRNE